MRWVRAAFVWLGLAAVSILVSAPPASATIVIVAVDRESGEVGAVGSSCAPVDLAGAVVLAPRVGAATVLGPREERPAGNVLRKLDEAGAAAVLRKVGGLDPDGAHRYALALLRPRTATGGSGLAPPIARGATTDTAAAQGEWLRNPAEVTRALNAFDASHGSLAERLLDALDAGNRGGGDRRCGRQRATSAFLIVTGPIGSVVIPARGLGDVRRKQQQILGTLGGQIASDEIADRLLEAAALPRPVGTGVPSVYLSLLQPRQGFDAVTLLRQAYEVSRRTPTPTATAAHTQDPEASDDGPTGVTALLVLGVAVVVVLALTRRSRLRASDETD